MSEAQIAVKGKVVAMDGNPIPYANITFRNFGTCSNDMGLFGLNISGVNKTIVIKISCVGYETKEVAVNQISPSIDLGTVTLNVKIMALDEVMVKAKMTTVEETLEKIYKNLGKNFSEKPFQRQVLARVNKFDRARKLLQVVN
ncbi:MAG: carboxypeptidase-like regulatory domain-containing protein, partial [Cyclobacteriaceae bacterium]